jgi:hypothetical protein
MNLWLFVLGLLVVCFTIFDMFYTVLVPRGAGPMTNYVTRLAGVFPRVLPSYLREKMHGWVGAGCLIGITFLWVLLMLFGWWMCFMADPQAIVVNGTGEIARGWTRVYFLGYTLLTLGVGDFVPGSDLWRVLTLWVSFTGLVVITTALSYVMPVLAAVVSKRQLACMLMDLGRSPQDVLLRHWDGENLSLFFNRMDSEIWPLLQQHSNRHLAYPILHYFMSHESEKALPVRLAVLSETLLICREIIQPHALPDSNRIRTIDSAINQFFEVLETNFIKPNPGDPPPPPAIDRLQTSSLPLTDMDPQAAIDKHVDRRLMLKAFLADERLDWDLVNQQGEEA